MSQEFCLSFPAVRGVQAGRIYYIATVPFRTVKNMFRLDVGDGSALSRSQREVNQTRAKKFAEYLDNNPSSFICPALTGVIDGEGSEFVASEVEGMKNVGVLKVPMDAGLLFVDGQHRATGITKAEMTGTASDSAPIMLFDNMTLEERQMAFSDINGNVAKPAQALSDAYNHRDDVAELARYVASVVPQFDGFVDYERNVISANSAYLFSLKTLKEANVRLLGIKKSDNISDDQRKLVVEFWTYWMDAIGFNDAFESAGRDAAEFRQQSIASTGVIMNAAALMGNRLITQLGDKYVDHLVKLEGMDWRRKGEGFANRCVNPELRTMKSDATAVKLTANALLMKMEVRLDPEAAQLEKQVFGNYEPPVQPTITADNQASIEHNLNTFGKLLLPINGELEWSVEQLQEAGEKMEVVYNDHEQDAVDELIKENEMAGPKEFSKARKSALKKVTKVYTDFINDPDSSKRSLLNLRHIRALVRQSINK